ncbi:MAG TPA: hypothetical protein VFI74_00470 [Candidatus Saccharimonadales bacterium]|nr:hypothetical protein [Candidatus Saccharimonadales bacterium]
MIVPEVKPFSEVPPLPQDVEARIAVYQKQQELLQQEVAHRHSDRVQANADAVHSSAAAVDVIFDYYRRELPDWERFLEEDSRLTSDVHLAAANTSQERSASKGQWIRDLGRLLCRPLAAFRSN